MKFGEQGFCKEHHTGFGFTDKVRLKFIGFIGKKTRDTASRRQNSRATHTHTHVYT